MSRRFALFVTTAALLAAVATPLTAQPVSSAPPQSGVRVSGSFGGFFGNDQSRISASGAVGYNFTRYFGMELEVGWAASGEDRPFSWPGDGPRILRNSRGMMRLAGMLPSTELSIPLRQRTSRTVTFLANAVADLPSGVPWLRTYVVGGGGVANVSTRLWPDGTFMYGLGGCSSLVGGAESLCIGVDQSDTALALNGGAGVEFGLVAGLWVGGDVRYLHVFGDRDDRGFTRAGARVSYRF